MFILTLITPLVYFMPLRLRSCTRLMPNEHVSYFHT